MTTGRWPPTPGPIGRFLLTTVGWPLALAATAMGLLTMYAVSGPGIYVRPLITAVAGWLFVGGIWIVRAVAKAAAARRFDMPDIRRSAWRDRGRVAVVPVLFMCTLGLIALDVPARVTFRMSRDDLDRVAAGSVPNGPVRIGWYGECFVDRRDGGTRIFVPGAGFFLSSTGFFYSPTGQAIPIHNGTLTRIDGPWFRWDGGFVN